MPEPHSADDPAPDLSQEELDSARQQLSAYRELIEEVPKIYERKFRERLEPIQARNQELLEEGRVLEEQLASRLPPGGVPPAPEALPPSRAQAPVQLPFHGARWRWLAFGSLAAFLLLGGGLLYNQREPRTAQAPPTRTSPRFANPPTQALPAKAAPINQRESPRPGELLLKTRGLSWLEVRSLADTTLFMGNLQGTKRFPLERGLRISAGRPDLVTVQRHGEPAKTLGGIREIGWHSFAPLPFAPLPSSEPQAPLPKQQSPNP